MNKYIIMEGRRSFYKNGGRLVSSYNRGSPQFNDFERGWSQELKRSSEQRPGNYWAKEKTFSRQRPELPEFIPSNEYEEMPDDIYVMLESRVKEKLRNAPMHALPKFAWPTKVYYVRIRTNQMPLWKIGVTSNDFAARYCIADRRKIVKIRSWQYATREEAEAIEREILAEFADDAYEGSPVLLSRGDSELFTRDVLMLDKIEDFHAIVRRETQARQI